MGLPNPAEIDLTMLPVMPYGQRHLLPNISAVYFVLTVEHGVLYVGCTKSLCFRWHLHRRCKDFDDMPDLRIAWVPVVEVRDLRPFETACITHFQPPYNRESRRPKTEKADYARFELRLPPDLLSAYRDLADYEGRAMNTQFLRSLQDWLKEHQPTRVPQKSHAPKDPHPTLAVGAAP